MNRYDYYTRHACFDEQAWLTAFNEDDMEEGEGELCDEEWEEEKDSGEETERR